MKKKKILFLAPHSFPIRSSESIVNAKLAYTLAEAGYDVEVISIDLDGTYPINDELNKQLSESKNLTINRIPSKGYNQRRPRNFLDCISSIIFHIKVFFTLGYAYNGIESSYLLYKALRNKARKEGALDFDVLITRGFSTELAAQYIKVKFAIPWVANWNDPFPDIRFPPPYGQGPNAILTDEENKFCNFLQKEAACHTFPSARLRDYMLSYFTEIDRSKTYVIPHMAHTMFMPEKKIKTDNGKLKLIHTGNVKAPRNPNNFIEALSQLIHKHPEYRQFITCDFYGHVPVNFVDIIAQLNLQGVVTVYPPIDYAETMQKTQEADIALVIEAICEEGIYLPTKVVDSLQSRTPLFAISPSKGTLRDYLTTYKIGYFAANTDVDAIEIQLNKMVIDFKENKLPFIDPQNVSVVFETEIIKQYRHLFEAIDEQ